MGVTPDEVRAAAAALPGVTERPHHGHLAFRTTRQFATLLPTALNLLVGESEARALLAERADVDLLMWGKNVAGVRAPLDGLNPTSLSELLRIAWEAYS